MNQGKLEAVKQEMARGNIDILGLSELRWNGMGEFNSDDHYIPLSHLQLFVAPWTVACQALLSMGFSRQENGWALEWIAIPSPGYLPDPGIKSGSPALQADSLPSEPPGKPIYIIPHTHTHTQNNQNLGLP